MLESIYVGMTGLLGYSRGLRVIANNTANLNTPGFKGSSVQFADLFYSRGNLSGGIGGQNYSQLGYGLDTKGTTLSFAQGELRQTGNDLDVAVDGAGLFTLQDAKGSITYTRAGQFQFNADGVLVSKSNGGKVMAYDGVGNLAPISLANARVNAGRATSSVRFNGNLSSTETDQTVGSIQVVDSAGGPHTLSARFTKADAGTTEWSVQILDGTTDVGKGTIAFADGKPKAGASSVSFTYSPAGSAAMPITLDFGTNVTSFASASTSTLAAASHDGYAPGSLTKAAFDETGTLVLSYSNGQTVKGPRLALGRFDSVDAVGSVGSNEFEALDGRSWHAGVATEGAFGTVRSGVIEISNVDLSQEFSDLVVMQRGYQASSQVISTANDMLQELFAMKK